ncbi:shikimate kinase [Arthrobacter sp. MN05-02]|nr:shikimate kinase [Arthrobacter sp. MN05-02]
METRSRLVLIGPMASGKSAVGRALAQRLHVPFIDSDRVIVERHGSIGSLFAREGEPFFRSIEADVAREALGTDDAVVSLGGGAVLHPRTRALLADAAVVFLDTDLDTVLPRISADTARPLLTGSPAERWQELYTQRRPTYASLASITIDTRGRSVRAVADAVLQELHRDLRTDRDVVPAPIIRPTDESEMQPHVD